MGRANESHLVWDWNGTLLDDLPIVLEAVNRSIDQFGFGPISTDDYRDHYTRPVRRFYDNLFGRAIQEAEWNRLNASFHDVYSGLVDNAGLASGARESIDLLAGSGWSQSLLSMTPQDFLDGVVASFGLTPHFDLVDGLAGPTGGLKAAHLEGHLRVLGLDGSAVVVVGDTPDDVAAARSVGARAVLYEGGSHHREVLEREGVPVAGSMADAVSIALSRP